MNKIMEVIKNKIKQKRPNIRDSSLNMYLNNLKKVNKELGNDNLYEIQTLENKDDITKLLKDKKDTTKKNYLASFIVLLMSDEEKYKKLIDEYRLEMELLAQKIDKFNKSQEKTDSQKKNWSTIEELQKIVNEYKKEIERKGLFKETALTKKEFNLVQKYVVGMLYIGDPKNNAPLRADYNDMKIIHISDYNKLSEEDLKKNYLVIRSKNKKFFSLGEYKTEGKYGLKIIPLGSKLNTVMNKWLKINKSGFLLLNSSSKPMTPNQLTKFVVRVFKPSKKEIGINILRHIVISELYPPKLKERSKTAEQMGHSVSQQELYSKK